MVVVREGGGGGLCVTWPASLELHVYRLTSFFCSSTDSTLNSHSDHDDKWAAGDDESVTKVQLVSVELSQSKPSDTQAADSLSSR